MTSTDSVVNIVSDSAATENNKKAHQRLQDPYVYTWNEGMISHQSFQGYNIFEDVCQLTNGPDESMALM